MNRIAFRASILSAALCCIATSGLAGAVRSGFDANTLAPGDDNSSTATSLGFAIQFGGSFSTAFVNNNGNLTFQNFFSDFSTRPIANLTIPFIGPFWGDVITVFDGAVTYGTGTVGTMNAFAATWTGVPNIDDAFGLVTPLPLSTFQVVLIDRSDIQVGDFDIEFNYDLIEWPASGAVIRAYVGYTNGSASSSFQLAGSGVGGAFVNGGANDLVANSLNSDVDGRYLFRVRNTPPDVVPEPSSLLIFASLIGVGARVRMGRQRRAQLAV
jgi:hypothetical protein